MLGDEVPERETDWSVPTDLTITETTISSSDLVNEGEGPTSAYRKGSGKSDRRHVKRGRLRFIIDGNEFSLNYGC